MKKFLLILSIISMAAISCSNSADPTNGNISVSGNVPSIYKDQKTGDSVSSWIGTKDGTDQATKSISASYQQNQQQAAAADVDLLARLYSTTWYQTESDWDDGREETETTFVLFNEDSSRLETEYETGERPETDYYTLSVADDTITTPVTLPYLESDPKKEQADKNAVIVKVQEKGDREVEYEGYYLYDRDTLYIVDGDRIDEVKTRLENIIKSVEAGNGSSAVRENKYTLYVNKQ
ncbi:hypothetical protein [uncultured Brachyspira sp.]|uniref:hypothetical protein n=1 Tax=uncultured Brachyspira sp. TaxID=221953 RepID=UPI002638DDC3|nr:hypothetical protein [uncultured Brachyspira sp.]